MVDVKIEKETRETHIRPSQTKPSEEKKNAKQGHLNKT